MANNTWRTKRGVQKETFLNTSTKLPTNQQVATMSNEGHSGTGDEAAAAVAAMYAAYSEQFARGEPFAFHSAGAAASAADNDDGGDGEPTFLMPWELTDAEVDDMLAAMRRDGVLRAKPAATAAGDASAATAAAAATAPPSLNSFAPLDRRMNDEHLDRLPFVSGADDPLLLGDVMQCDEVCATLCKWPCPPLDNVDTELPWLIADMKVAYMTITTLLAELAQQRSSPAEQQRYVQHVRAATNKLRRCLLGDEHSDKIERRQGAYSWITGAEPERLPVVRQVVQRGVGLVTKAC